MPCEHDSYHELRCRYDRGRGELVYTWMCERCGLRLREAGREPYRPHFDPSGNDSALAAQAEAAASAA